MQNRNQQMNVLSRGNSRPKINQNSFEVTSHKNYNFLQEDFAQNFPSSLPSPIDKVRFQMGSNIQQNDILNYSSNSYMLEQTVGRKSAIKPAMRESPVDISKMKFFAGKKMSVPDGSLGQKMEWDRNLRKQQLTENYRGTKPVNMAINYQSKPQINEVETEYSSATNISQREQNISQADRYFSHKSIQINLHQQKYNQLSRNYQQLQEQFQKMKQQNLRLKRSREQLMDDNMRVKRQGSLQIEQLSGQIQALKEHIYRIQMEHQQPNTSRGFNSTSKMNFSRNTISSARGSSTSTLNEGSINLFYLQQLEKQNSQLIQENRRLNNIVMKRLKHSIAD